MARYLGPKSKISRKFGEPIFGPSKALQKKAYGPGHHGRSRRRKPSEYSIQLAAKQKAKYIYGVLEKQFSNLFQKASRKKGITGEILLQMLEARLDNTVYRFGIAPSRRAARQLVVHKHITVNGKVVGIPSYTLRASDLVSIREKSRSLEAITTSITEHARSFPWLEWDSSALTGKFLNPPRRDEIPENIQEQLIVELYSK